MIQSVLWPHQSGRDYMILINSRIRKSILHEVRFHSDRSQKAILYLTRDSVQIIYTHSISSLELWEKTQRDWYIKGRHNGSDGKSQVAHLLTFKILCKKSERQEKEVEHLQNMHLKIAAIFSCGGMHGEWNSLQRKLKPVHQIPTSNSDLKGLILQNSVAECWPRGTSLTRATVRPSRASSDRYNTTGTMQQWHGKKLCNGCFFMNWRALFWIVESNPSG